MLVALLLIWGTSANATTIVSYQRPPDVATIGGTTVRAADLVDVDSSGLVFDAFGTNPTFEDVNAAHLLSDGRILFSTVTSATIDGQSFTPGDLILYDATAPDTMKASLFLDGSAVFANVENLDAIFLFEQGPNQGKVLLSTALSASIGALSFGGGDLILTDVAGVSPQLFFDGTTLISGTAGQKEVDAVHLLENGHLLLSINQNGGSLAGFALREQDLVEYDPAGAGSASLFLDGDGLFDGTTVDLNAVTSVIPEPGTLSLLAIGLLGLAFHRRR